MDEQNTFNVLESIPKDLLPSNPKANACITCENATWFVVGDKAMAHCSKMFMFTWGDGKLTSIDKKTSETVGVSICKHNPTFKPNSK
ncbi:MAG: hypothetical protein PHW29_04415 [Flavobacterium sp.]|nr:hypothetical protein [Flavobacterium sp.]